VLKQSASVSAKAKELKKAVAENVSCNNILTAWPHNGIKFIF